MLLREIETEEVGEEGLSEEIDPLAVEEVETLEEVVPQEVALVAELPQQKARLSVLQVKR